MVVLQQIAPAPVTEALGVLGRSDDVGEQDGGEAPVEVGGPARPGEELLDLVEHRVGIAEVRERVFAGQLDVLRVRDPAGRGPV
jgi:hypothetical protein